MSKELQKSMMTMSQKKSIKGEIINKFQIEILDLKSTIT